jgi:hypothetical protein
MYVQNSISVYVPAPSSILIAVGCVIFPRLLSRIRVQGIENNPGTLPTNPFQFQRQSCYSNNRVIQIIDIINKLNCISGVIKTVTNRPAVKS